MKPKVLENQYQLSFWMNGSYAQKLVTLYKAWWLKVKSWITWPQQQFDPQQAALPIVDLLAWQRNIDRLPEEPEWLYRLRVQHAKANANDAGSIQGFKEIWRRLKLGELVIHERVEGRDWDVIQLEVTDTALAKNEALFREIIRLYGRTCRRYEYSTVSPFTIFMHQGSWEHEFQYSVATLKLS